MMQFELLKAQDRAYLGALQEICGSNQDAAYAMLLQGELCQGIRPTDTCYHDLLHHYLMVDTALYVKHRQWCRGLILYQCDHESSFKVEHFLTLLTLPLGPLKNLMLDLNLMVHDGWDVQSASFLSLVSVSQNPLHYQAIRQGLDRYVTEVIDEMLEDYQKFLYTMMLHDWMIEAMATGHINPGMHAEMPARLVPMFQVVDYYRVIGSSLLDVCQYDMIFKQQVINHLCLLSNDELVVDFLEARQLNVLEEPHLLSMRWLLLSLLNVSPRLADRYADAKINHVLHQLQDHHWTDLNMIAPDQELYEHLPSECLDKFDRVGQSDHRLSVLLKHLPKYRE